MKESQLIKKELTRLRGFGFRVFNFNNSRANNAGTTGHPDWLIIKPKKYIVWIETKIGDDKLSEIQQAVINELSHFAGLPNSPVHVRIIKNQKDAQTLQQQLLTNKL
jgi:predicted type IV restriction endonuclease